MPKLVISITATTPSKPASSRVVPEAPSGQGSEGNTATGGEEAQPDVDDQADHGEVAAEVSDRGVILVFLIVIVATLAVSYLLKCYFLAVNRLLASIRLRFCS